jgi:predicted DNA-binding transcriptional regulator AlpA
MTKPAYPPDYCSAQTLAHRLDMSERTVADYVRSGLLPQPIVIGNLKRWSWIEVVAFLNRENALAEASADTTSESDEYSAAIKQAIDPQKKASAHD